MLDHIHSVFIVGIKGAAMSNLALILKQMGKQVSGADVDEVFITDEVLDRARIQTVSGFEPHNLPQKTDLLIYSAAHGGETNPLVAEARKRHIPAVTQSFVLGELIKKFKTSVAVAGCHGKTTTSSLLAFALQHLSVHPSFLIGAPTFVKETGGCYDGKDYFVIEADEYGIDPPRDKTPKFLSLHPTHILCTNIDFDHPDVYSSIHDTIKAFSTFFSHTSRLILCFDDQHIQTILSGLTGRHVLTYGYDNRADLVIGTYKSTENASSFHLSYNKYDLGEFTTGIFGTKNISNAAGVVLTLIDLGFKPEEIRMAIRGFSGVKRRFERIYQGQKAQLFDDYGHHPAEIKATIQAARLRFPDRRIIVLFQPHTFSRTSALAKDFAESLKDAHLALIAPIFASAREQKSDQTITSNLIETYAKEMGYGNVLSCDTMTELIKKLEQNIRKNDIVFTMGAGDIYKLKNDIIPML